MCLFAVPAAILEHKGDVRIPDNNDIALLILFWELAGIGLKL